MTSLPLPAHELARRLLGGEWPAGASPETVAADGARACERVVRDLSRWFGIEGSSALFARALAHAQADHPALENVRVAPQSAPRLEGLTECARTHGANAAAEGVAAILASLIELLGRLIGDDLAMRLIEQSVPEEPGRAKSTDARDAK